MVPHEAPSTPSELEYYTDSERLREAFRQTVTADLLPVRLFVVHGVGGIGKTELLRVFRRQCIDNGIAVGLASGHSDSERTGMALLGEWADDLASSGVELQPFTKQRNQLAKLLLRVDRLAGSNTGETSRSIASGTAATVTNLLVPPAAPLVSATLDVIVDRFRPDFQRDEIELMLHQDARLSGTFMESINSLATERRVVLIADALDRLGSLEFWLGDIARELPSDALMVVAGQQLPRWSKPHDSDRPSGSQPWAWRRVAAIHEITPLSDEDTRTLVRAYHRFQMGVDADERAVNLWVAKSRGVPLKAAFAVDRGLDVEDQRVAESEALAEQRDYYLAAIPVELRPFAAAAATVRHFDRSTLSAVYGSEVSTEEFTDLTRKSYAKRVSAGDRIVFQLHDQMRYAFDDDLHVNDLDLDREYHLRAAVHFARRRDESGSPTVLNAAWLKWQTEYALQLLQGGDERGLRELHTTFGSALQHLRYDACRAMIEDLGSLHRLTPVIEHRTAYYDARLTAAEYSWAFVDDATMLAIVANAYIDEAIDWEAHWARAQQLSYASRPSEAIESLEASLRSLTAAGQRRTAAGSMVLSWLAGQHRVHDRGETAPVVRAYLDEAVSISGEIGDPYSLNHALLETAHADFTAGHFNSALDGWERALEVVRSVGNLERTADGLNRVALALTALGRYGAAEETLSEAMEVASGLPDAIGGRQDKEMYILRHLGVLRHETGRCVDAVDVLRRSASAYRSRRSTNGLLRTLVLQAECQYHSGNLADLEVLQPELAELAGRASLGDWVARWECISGHVTADRWLHGSVPLAQVADMYLTALVSSLEWSMDALDRVASRILWRVSLIPGERADCADALIRCLRSSWKRTPFHDRTCSEVHEAMRPTRVAMSAGVADFLLETLTTDQVLADFERPHAWEGL